MSPPSFLCLLMPDVFALLMFLYPLDSESIHLYAVLC